MLFADDFVYANLKYTTNSDNSVTVVDGKRASGEVIIPFDVRNKNKVYVVTAIEHNAFEGNNAITAVTIPSSVSTIGYSAFNSCKSLRRVMDASRVTEMQGFEYTDCTNLTSVTLSGALQKVGYRSFAGTALTQLVLPASMKEIGSSAFEDCHQLTNVEFNKGIQNIKDHAFKNSGLAFLALPESIKEKFPTEVMTKSFQELRPELYSDEATDESVKAEGDRIRGLMEDVNNFIKSYLDGVRQRSVQYIELREKIKK